jgi:23S rRNA-/tRNA-specific pseudouridylate synthase
MTIVDKYRGKSSLTHFRLLGSAGNYSVLEARPETGRTHQIRAHAAALGFPVACDPLYGNGKPVLLSSFKRNWRGDPLAEKPLLARLGLHAEKIIVSGSVCGSQENSESTFPAQCPDSNLARENLDLHAPLPRDMAALIKQIEKEAGNMKAPRR